MLTRSGVGTEQQPLTSGWGVREDSLLQEVFKKEKAVSFKKKIGWYMHRPLKTYKCHSDGANGPRGAMGLWVSCRGGEPGPGPSFLPCRVCPSILRHTRNKSGAPGKASPPPTVLIMRLSGPGNSRPRVPPLQGPVQEGTRLAAPSECFKERGQHQGPQATDRKDLLLIN